MRAAEGHRSPLMLVEQSLTERMIGLAIEVRRNTG